MPQLRLLKTYNGHIKLPLSVLGVNAQTPFTMKYHENPPCIYHFHTAVVMTCADREQLVTGSTYSEMFARINVAAAYLQRVLFARLLTVSTVYVLATPLSPPSPLNGSLRPLTFDVYIHSRATRRFIQKLSVHISGSKLS